MPTAVARGPRGPSIEIEIGYMGKVKIRGEKRDFFHFSRDEISKSRYSNLFNFENSKKLESDSKMFRYRKYEIL